jgi:DNA-binding ferritin-like protein
MINKRAFLDMLSEISTKDILLGLLTALIATRLSHHTTHWQVRGTNFYGDHTMFERLYESLDDEIDTLAEKIVAEHGPEGVDLAELSSDLGSHLTNLSGESSDPVIRALTAESGLQAMFKQVYHTLKNRDELSLGMDDFLMAMANAHETNVYLLRQRFRG